MTDYSTEYNTPLDPAMEKAFTNWAQQTNRMGDLYDYDLRGAFKQMNGQIPEGHLPDTFKKPNHPTFSDESQYSGKNGLQGGHWEQHPDGKYSFKPGSTNLQNFTPLELQHYFNKVEPGNQLVLPEE